MTRDFLHYKKRFPMPGQSESMYYSWNLGPVHFIAFNTEFYGAQSYSEKKLVDQFNWIQQDLTEANKPQTRKKRPWIITYGHRPMYCTSFGSKADCQVTATNLRDGVKNKKQGRMHGLETLFMENGVDISFWGHTHAYVRFWPLYQSTVKNGSTNAPYVNPKGLVHIISGSAVRKNFIFQL